MEEVEHSPIQAGQDITSGLCSDWKRRLWRLRICWQMQWLCAGASAPGVEGTPGSTRLCRDVFCQFPLRNHRYPQKPEMCLQLNGLGQEQPDTTLMDSEKGSKRVDK
jgi:hypothetical protein